MKGILNKTTLGLTVIAAMSTYGVSAEQGQDASFKNIDAQLEQLSQAVKSNGVLQPISAQPSQPDLNLVKPPQTQSNGVQTFSAASMPAPSEVRNIPEQKAVSGPIISAERPVKTTADISAMVATAKPSIAPPQATLNNTIKPTSAGSSVAQGSSSGASIPTIDSVARGTKLGELPPLSRFEFTRSVFIPANKSGVLFVNGAEVANIEATADPSALMNGYKPEAQVCMLLSDKNYIMMRGAEEAAGGRNPSYLDVAGVKFFDYPTQNSKSPLGQSVSTISVTVDFVPKSVSSGDKSNSVSISLTCRIPPSMSKDLKGYTLENINTGFGGLFKVTLPRYTEI